MLENWTFGRKLAAGFATAALTTLLIAVLGFQSADRLIETDKWVTHTYRVRSELALLLALITEAETGQRGFIVTGRDDFLEPYTVAAPKIEKVFQSLRSQTGDNEQQQGRLRAIKPLIDEKLTLLKENVERRRQHGFAAAHDVMLRGEGKRAMDSIRQLIEELDAHERTLLAQRSQQAEESTRWTKGVILWSSLGGLAFIIVVATLISRSLTEQVGSAVREIQTSSTELQAAADQQLTGAKEHATAMNEISTTIRELLATSRQIAQSAQRVVQIAEETATFARSGDSTVVRGQDATAGIQRQVDLIVSHMLELGKKSQQIGSVLDIVSELAEQTNILAINATIEAAGAGESGRRFAVVAEEIRKLADRVGRSTKEIRTLINDIQSAVNTTVMSTETGSKAVDSGTRQFAEVAAAFRQIAGLVSTTTDAAREIELSTKQQTTAVEQVNIAITSAAQATKESETSSSQTLQTASQLSQLSNGLLRIVEPRGGSRRNGIARI